MTKKLSFPSFFAGLALLLVTLVGSSKLSGQSSDGFNQIDSVATARLQVIHNSADAAAAVVDVWVNSTKLIPNFSFRTASPFIDAPAGVLLNISIAPPNSTSWTQALYVKQVSLTANQTYIAVANGIVSTSGYSPSPTFNLGVYPIGREAASQAGNTDILVVHGSTDAPVVDIKAGSNTLVNNLAYGMIDGYLEVPTNDLVLDIADETGANVLLQYSAPLATLGLQDSALTVLASGFLNPANNSNSSNNFGLWVALPSGGNLIPLPLYTPPVGTARLQVIHNSADAAAAVVDVWVAGTKLIPNFAFRTATPFIDAPAGIPLDIVIAPANSTSASQGIATFPVTLAQNQTYVVVANGIVSPAGYSPSPAFNLNVYPMGREAASQAGNTDILVVHGSTDAPVVDIKAGNTTLVDNLAYGMFDGYLEVPTADLVIDIADQTGTNVLLQYSAPLATLGLQNGALTVVASGFLDPAANSNSPNNFGLWVALPSGGNMIPLPLFTQSVNDVDKSFQEVAVFPNPARAGRLNIAVSMDDPIVDIRIVDVTGRTITSTTLQGSGLVTETLDVSALNPGLYLVRFVSDNHQHTEKVFVGR
jgi:hypothetical protein